MKMYGEQILYFEYKVNICYKISKEYLYSIEIINVLLCN